MNENLSITTERVDDIPLLLHQMERISLAETLDAYLPAHGNRKGMSLGNLTSVWLTHILSQSDHRMNQVREWACQRQGILEKTLSIPFLETDYTDDRLADVLRALNNDVAWEAIEAELTQNTIRVYELPTEVVRLDSTTASAYTDPDGVFQYGHSKDHRPDLPQLKMMLATLDPLAMPIATQIVPGNSADDPLYLPAIEAVRKTLKKQGVLYVGDAKMGALATRAAIDKEKDYYLCPLSQVQMPLNEIEKALQPVWKGAQPLVSIEREDANGQCKAIAEGFEWLVTQNCGDITWQERYLLVRSHSFAKAAERSLEERLPLAQQKIIELTCCGKGKRLPKDKEQAEAAIKAILKQHRVDGLLKVDVTEHITTRCVRGYKGQPPRDKTDIYLQIECEIDAQAVASAKSLLGWRVFVTNSPSERLSLAKAILCYRDEYRIEHNFSRFKGRPLSLSPFYVQRDDHAIGLMRLLSIALRLLSVLEFDVRRKLEKEAKPLAGLYAGNPKRATKTPTAELLLKAFNGITLTVVETSGHKIRHLPTFSEIQVRILDLLGFGQEMYRYLLRESDFLPSKMSEP